MQIIHRLDDLRAQLHTWRVTRERIAFVPTMGNLHDGHLELVKMGADIGDKVIVSVFVNPLQFGEGEDFDLYPRTLEADAVQLRDTGVDLLFAPTASEIYPQGVDILTEVAVRDLSTQLCGAFRPGHFEGVTTVVNLLLNLVRPRFAIFGEKDYQQLVLIRRMVRELHLDIEVIGGPTIREETGLARSSRNAYLSEEERGKAPTMYRMLCDIARELREGGRDFDAMQRRAMKTLDSEGFQAQYVEVRGTELEPPTADMKQVVVLAAALLGKARLIDNVRVRL